MSHNDQYNQDLPEALRQFAEAANFPMVQAPGSALKHAKAIFQGRPVSTMARIGLNLGFAGSRSVAGAMERAQVSFERDGVNARLLFNSEGKNWRVMGRVATGSSDWLALVGDQSLPMDANGQFEGLLHELPTEVVLLSPNSTYLLPIQLED